MSPNYITLKNGHINRIKLSGVSHEEIEYMNTFASGDLVTNLFRNLFNKENPHWTASKHILLSFQRMPFF